MGWSKGLLSIGGVTQGKVIQTSTSMFYPWSVAPNDYTLIQNDNSADGVDHDITNLSCDLPYTEGQTLNDFVAAAKFPVTDDDGVILNYIGVRYKYNSGISFGVSRVGIEMQLGYWDAQNNWINMGGNTIGTYSQQTSVYPFKIKLHICSGKTTGENPYDYFGAVVSIEATDRAKFVYAGILSSQTYVRGNKDEIGEFSPEFGPASEPDGYGQGGVIGSHDKHSDHVGIPTKPQYGFTSAGFLNHYRISAQGLSMLGEALFPEPQGPSADVLGAIDRLTANLWNSKIIDYIIDCRIIPVTAPATNMENITCGGKVLVHPTSQQPYSAYLVDEDFVDVDCGVVSTPLTEGNFLDMISKAKIFIPFYGFVDLAPEYWHGAKIGLYYRFNLMDGSFMAWLTSAPFRSELESASDMEIIGQYAGNACIHLPINSQSYSQIIGGMITTGAAVVGAAAAGAIGGAAAKTIAAGAVQTAVSGAANIASGRPQLINNNSYNGSAALMSCRTPYLLIEFSEAQFSRRYVDENGLPAIINRVLGTMSGFTTCVNPIIDFACEEQEAEEIRNLLKSGVIL